MFVEYKFDVLSLNETKLKRKGECEFVREWKDVRWEQRESKRRSEIVCGGMEISIIKANMLVKV